MKLSLVIARQSLKYLIVLVIRLLLLSTLFQAVYWMYYSVLWKVLAGGVDFLLPKMAALLLCTSCFLHKTQYRQTYHKNFIAFNILYWMWNWKLLVLSQCAAALNTEQLQSPWRRKGTLSGLYTVFPQGKHFRCIVAWSRLLKCRGAFVTHVYPFFLLVVSTFFPHLFINHLKMSFPRVTDGQEKTCIDTQLAFQKW